MRRGGEHPNVPRTDTSSKYQHTHARAQTERNRVERTLPGTYERGRQRHSESQGYANRRPITAKFYQRRGPRYAGSLHEERGSCKAGLSLLIPSKKVTKIVFEGFPQTRKSGEAKK